MKRLILLIGIIILVINSCKKQGNENSTPTCVLDKINAFATSSPCDNAQVDEYMFQGNTVYVFGEGTCAPDLSSEVIDYNCHILGYLGGYFGFTEINGEKFIDAKFIKTIWKK